MYLAVTGSDLYAVRGVFMNSFLHECFSRSPDVTSDEQPPALPPKQSRRDPLTHNGRSQSQHELDEHLSELYNVPAASGKSMVRKTLSYKRKRYMCLFISRSSFDSFLFFFPQNGAVPHDNLFWLKWGQMKTDDLDLTLRCVFGYSTTVALFGSWNQIS